MACATRYLVMRVALISLWLRAAIEHAQYHAVLAVHLNGQSYILDNLSSRVLPDGALKNYVPIESFSGSRSFIHGFARKPIETAALTRAAQPAD